MMLNYLCSDFRKQLKLAEKNLWTEEMTTPKAVISFAKKMPEPSRWFTRKYVYVDYICSHKGRMLQRIFAVFWKPEKQSTVVEVCRHYEYGSYIMSNMNYYGYVRGYQPVDSGRQSTESTWAGNFTNWVDFNDAMKSVWSWGFGHKRFSHEDECYHANSRQTIKKFGPYCDYEEYRKGCNCPYSLMRYLEEYHLNPHIESLVKMGYPQFVKQWRRLNWNAKHLSFSNIFCVDRKWSDYFKSRDVSMRELKALWIDPTIKTEAELKRVVNILDETSNRGFSDEEQHYLIKMVDKIKETDGFEFGRFISLYSDYLKLAEKANWKMDGYRHFPRVKDIHRLHNEALHDVKELEKQEREKERKKREILLRTGFHKNAVINSKYKYSAYGCVIIPAESPRQLYDEGDFIGHCVGRCGYDMKCAQGKSFIFFVRHEESPDVPYTTVELDKTGKIVQCYGHGKGTGDTKPNDDACEAIMSWKQHFGFTGWSADQQYRGY